MGAADTLRQRIWSAFPPHPFYGTVTRCECTECTEIRASLRHKSWDALDDATMNAQFGSLGLLTSDAFWAFLPAWLIRSLDGLDDPEHRVREWSLYALALYYDEKDDNAEELARKTERVRRQYERLTPNQARVMEEFLLVIRSQARISDWDRESIDRTLPLLRQHPAAPMGQQS